MRNKLQRLLVKPYGKKVDKFNYAINWRGSMISYKNQLYNKKIIIIGFIVTIMLATISSLNYKHGIILILLFLVAHIPIMRNNLYMIYMILFFCLFTVC